MKANPAKKAVKLSAELSRSLPESMRDIHESLHRIRKYSLKAAGYIDSLRNSLERRRNEVMSDLEREIGEAFNLLLKADDPDVPEKQKVKALDKLVEIAEAKQHHRQ